MSEDDFEITQVHAWEGGHHDESGTVVIVFRFSDGPPMAWACDPDLAAEIGEGLLTLATQARKRRN